MVKIILRDYCGRYIVKAMQRGTTMDFQKIVTEILETGMTQTELAKRCGHGTTQGHISAIYTGRRGDKVGYQLGDALVKIHRRAMRTKVVTGHHNN